LNVTQEGIVPESMCQVSVYGSIKINNEWLEFNLKL
jgi:hypothetical protein